MDISNDSKMGKHSFKKVNLGGRFSPSEIRRSGRVICVLVILLLLLLAFLLFVREESLWLQAFGKIRFFLKSEYQIALHNNILLCQAFMNGEE
jgi:hypothetical protein